VAVFEANLTSGSHPFNVGTKGKFSSTTWTEGVVSDYTRTFPAPGATGLGIPNFAHVVVSWERNTTGTVLVTLRTSGGVSRVWTGTTQADTTWATRSVVMDGGLCVAELMMWRGSAALTVQTTAGRASLSAFLLQKWSVTLVPSLTDANVVSASLPVSIVINARIVISNYATGFIDIGEVSLMANNGSRVFAYTGSQANTWSGTWANVNDGNLSTYWASNPAPTTPTPAMTLDYKLEGPVTEIRIWPRTIFPERLYNRRVEYFVDGVLKVTTTTANTLPVVGYFTVSIPSS
jgi:hypothetical protein